MKQEDREKWEAELLAPLPGASMPKATPKPSSAELAADRDSFMSVFNQRK